MKTMKLLLSLFALLTITACSSDDEPIIVELQDLLEKHGLQIVD